MFFADLFAALIVGVIIVFALSTAFGTKGPWGSLLWFFIIVALFAWTGGVWLRPYGPVWYGVSWIPIIVIGLFIAILLTALSPRNPRYPLSAQKKSKVIEERKADADVFFWVLILCLVMLAMSHFFWFPQFGWY
ncbi:MAG TPA: hypothetical protein VN963_02070 [bacterium]|nr:hypothetical protein [bacterium]